MNKKSTQDRSWISTSWVDIPTTKDGFANFLEKTGGLPLREIEVEPDSIAEVVEWASNHALLITAMINYPLGGCEADYILDSIRWVCDHEIDIVCSNLPLHWLRANKLESLHTLLGEMKQACGEKPLRISLDSDSLSEEELITICDLLSELEINHLKSSCGFSHSTSSAAISTIKKNYPDIILAVDNNLQGDASEIDSLLRSGVNIVCIKEPWLYHFREQKNQ